MAIFLLVSALYPVCLTSDQVSSNSFKWFATSRSDLDVESGDAELLASSSDILSGLHSSVWRGLVSIGFDLHTTRNSGDGLLAGEIGDVHKGIVIRSVEVANTENVLAVSDLWAELDDLLLFDNLLLWGHDCVSVSST